MPDWAGVNAVCKGSGEERFLTSAGRPFHRSERERKNRPAPFGMTVGERGKEKLETRARNRIKVPTLG
jgi:hypothetical protein